MYYRKTLETKLDKNLFENPTNEYRACPFWAWNTELKPEYLEEQIIAFKEMGFGGFFMHSRIGLQTEYLGKEFFEAVKQSVSIAKTNHMQAWIYDEDRYPSGFAGGLVTRDYQYRYKYLVFSKELPDNMGTIEQLLLEGTPHLLAVYDVKLNEVGELSDYKKIERKEDAKDQCWYAYLAVHQSNWWYNGQAYIDTLSPEPMKRFLEVTHEQYKERFEEHFGNVIPGVFTDEPQPLPDVIQSNPLSGEPVTFSWTIGLEEQFELENGFSLLEKLPELVWELHEGKVSRARYCYRKMVSDKFYDGFFVPYAKWCNENNLVFTGHLQDENTLIGQTKIMGEAMRCYKEFKMPGIDILCDNIELCTAKQAQSVAHQEGKEGVVSELYGATNWDFDFRKHKFQGDWQAALGVTLRVPHLAWLSMEGPAKRDYPATIGIQSPWYKEYAYLENHYARINTALTRGKAVVKIGVIHPIESLWLEFGNKFDTEEKVNLRQKQFEELTEWLLYGKQDFDFISEALLLEQFKQTENGQLCVGEMSYDAVVVPPCLTLRDSTVEILKQYVVAGGRLIFTEKIPTYVDAVLEENLEQQFSSAIVVPHEQQALLSVLEEQRMIEMLQEDGSPDRMHFYQLREDGEDLWLFVAQGKKNPHVDKVHKQQVIIKVKGKYEPVCYDTLTGEIRTLEYKLVDEYTEIPYCLYHYDSLLVRLTNNTKQSFCQKQDDMLTKKVKVMELPQTVNCQREESNVCLLDMAEWQIDDGEWQLMEEVLKIDRLSREKLGYPLKGTLQPWTISRQEPKHTIHLKFIIPSETKIDFVELAYEQATCICWNGQNVMPIATEYYVDKAIKKLKLPEIKEGLNVLEVWVPIDEYRGPEAFYLLGDFDVKVDGCNKTIVESSDQIRFGDIVPQGLPFYGGNLRYAYEFYAEGNFVKVQVPHYRGSVIKVLLDNVFVGYVAFEPYEIDIKVTKGNTHKIDFLLCGNRVNTFGSLHNADDSITRFGPPAWQTEGEAWSDEYRFWKMGIMAPPQMQIYIK